MEFLRSFSLTKILFLFIVILSLVVTIIFYQQRIHQFNDEIRNLKTEYKLNVEKTLKKEIDTAVDYINYKKEMTLNRLKKELKENVLLGDTIASEIYLKYKDTKSEAEILEIIKTSLREIRFFENRGYFFLYKLDGKSIMHPIQPNVENTYNHKYIVNKNGKKLLKEIENRFLTKNEFYIDYYYDKNGENKNEVSKIGFVKKLDFYNLYIGTAEYLDDFEETVKKEIINRLSKVRFGKEGYLFIDSFDGVVLMHPMKPEIVNKNLINHQDDNGKFVIKELIEAAKTKDGRFVYYSWNRPNSLSKEFNKVSFARGIADWKWIVGGGLYLDNINDELKLKEESFRQKLHSEIISSLLVIFVIASIFFLLLYMVNRTTTKSFENMVNFLEEASEKNIFLDEKKIYFKEFHKLLEVINNMISIRKENEEQLYKYQEELKYQANHDFLTNLYNRKFFMEVSQSILSLIKREDEPLCVMMIDIDDFKVVNDNFGHKVGDKVLVFLSEKFRRFVRKSDICARLGGEEFAILMPNADSKGALQVANKLIQEVDQSRIQVDNSQLHFTISIGIDEYRSCEKIDDNIEQILNRADKALYQSKNSGKNRATLYIKE